MTSSKPRLLPHLQSRIVCTIELQFIDPRPSSYGLPGRVLLIIRAFDGIPISRFNTLCLSRRGLNIYYDVGVFGFHSLHKFH